MRAFRATEMRVSDSVVDVRTILPRERHARAFDSLLGQAPAVRRVRVEREG